MINNSYVRGYFDGHGIVAKRYGGVSGCDVRIYENDFEQIERVAWYLAGCGYKVHVHAVAGRYVNGVKYGVKYRLQIGKRDDVVRFYFEIGTEKPKWNERFKELLPEVVSNGAL